MMTASGVKTQYQLLKALAKVPHGLVEYRLCGKASSTLSITILPFASPSYRMIGLRP